jgi:hypothetical protein
MDEKAPIMDEFTHDRIMDALLDLKMERPDKARRSLHRALDRLDDDQTEWENQSGTDQKIAYGLPLEERGKEARERVFQAFSEAVTQPTEDGNEGA